MADAAVLQTHREIYAVVIDDKMHELNDQVKKYKQEDTDMVPVEIRGEIKPKPEGEVSIDKMPTQSTASNKKVGEYVDYEEID